MIMHDIMLQQDSGQKSLNKQSYINKPTFIVDFRPEMLNKDFSKKYTFCKEIFRKISFYIVSKFW